MAPGLSDQTIASGSHYTLIHVSYLRKLYPLEDGSLTLHQSKITSWASYDDWSAFVDGFLATATYPKAPLSKFETYGWTPTLFEMCPVDFFDADKGEKHSRHGDYAAEDLSFFIADLDNHIEDQPRVSIEAVTEMLKQYGLSHLLYTSYSHKPDQHKVRIVIPTSRYLMQAEAFAIFHVFNAAMNFQLDGSIYDPGDYLYGPSINSIIVRHDAADLDVEAWLAVAAQLPEEVRNYVNRAPVRERRQPTAKELEAQRLARASRLQNGDVSIHNPKVFNPAWFNDLDNRYIAQSHHQSVMGLLVRCWLKSKMTLSRLDLEHLQFELDTQLGGYLSTNYKPHILAADIDKVMTMVGTTSSPPKTETKMNATEALKYLKLKRKK